MPRTLKLTIAYDGTDYAGWQFQPDQRTLQGSLEAALAKVTTVPTRVFASGRTDAGVHALGQVVSFDTESQLPAAVFQKALNAELPRDMAVVAAEEAPLGFNALRDAKRKRYRYAIHNAAVRDVFALRYAWHVFRPLDVAAMQRAANVLVGTHDFASFETSGSERESTVRTIYDLKVERPPATGQGRGGAILESMEIDPPNRGGAISPTLHIEVEANGFLYNMVRNIVGTLVDVGQGRAGESHVEEVLAARDRRRAGQTAPPQGLCLQYVVYDAAIGRDQESGIGSQVSGIKRS